MAEGKAVGVTGLELVLLFAVGLLAGVVNTLAGGGSLLTLPALIFLGLPPTVANGTNRVGVLLQSVVAARTFSRRGVLDSVVARRLLIPACAGATIGAWVSVDLDEAVFRRVIGVLMLGMVGLMALDPKRWLEGRVGEAPAHLAWSGPLAFFGIGLYGGFLQAGVGMLLLAGLVLLQGQDLLRANAIKVLLVAGFTVPPLLIFAAHGLIHWLPALLLAAGSMLGAWLGVHFAISGGARRVRQAVILAIAVSAVRLLYPA